MRSGRTRSGRRCGGCSGTSSRSRRPPTSDGCFSRPGCRRNSVPRPPRSCGSGLRRRPTGRRRRGSSPRAAGCFPTTFVASSTSTRPWNGCSPRRGRTGSGSGWRPGRAKRRPGPPGPTADSPPRSRRSASTTSTCGMRARTRRPCSSRPPPASRAPSLPGIRSTRHPLRPISCSSRSIVRPALCRVRSGWPRSGRTSGSRRSQSSSTTPCTARVKKPRLPGSFPSSRRSATRLRGRSGPSTRRIRIPGGYRFPRVPIGISARRSRRCFPTGPSGEPSRRCWSRAGAPATSRCSPRAGIRMRGCFPSI